MYCFRCGRKLPGREINCPDCDTPKKRRQRRHRRMLLGLFIFLSGAFVGSFFDTYIFKGEAWKYSFFSEFLDKKEGVPNKVTPTESFSSDVKIEFKSNDSFIRPEKEETTEKLKPADSLLGAAAPSEAEKTNDENLVVAEITQGGSAKTGTSAAYPPSNQASVTEITSRGGIGRDEDDDIVSDEVVISLVPEETLNSDDSYTYSEVDPIKVETAFEAEKNFVYKSLSLLDSGHRDCYHGFLSKDGKELVFASNRLNYNGKPTFQCFIKSPSDKEAGKPAFEWKGNVWTPEFTPDSNMIVFSSDSTKPEHIFLYDRKSGNSMALTSGNSKNMMPSISPDGKRIAFVSNRSGKYCIWVMNLFDKSKIAQITRGDVNDREPRWYPDGKSLVFTRIVENMKVSHIMKVDLEPLKAAVPIVSSKYRNWMPSISPDAKLLAYTRSQNAGGSKNVIILQDIASGKEEIMNFPDIYESLRPVWNTNGSGFIFHVAKKTGKSLYQANFVRE